MSSLLFIYGEDFLTFVGFVASIDISPLQIVGGSNTPVAPL
jgi:hypothetical protein